MISEWVVHEPIDGPYERCIIALPGRGNSTEMMVRVAKDLQLPRTLIVSVRPWGSAWYPQPYSSANQAEAVAGLPAALDACCRVVDTIRRAFHLPHHKMALLGYSAGGVMSIQTAVNRMKTCGFVDSVGMRPFAGVVVYCGAILEPDDLPPAPAAKHRSPMLLVHNRDDSCFDWFERYLPMKYGLWDKGYDVEVCENGTGGHMIHTADVFVTSRFLGRCFGIKNWAHPREDEWLRFLAEKRRAQEEDNKSEQGGE